MGTSPTDRLTGQNAKVFIGSTSGTSDVYAASDMEGCNLDLSSQKVELTANDDDYVVEKVTVGQGKITVNKFVNATKKFITSIKKAFEDKEAVYLSFQDSAGEICNGLFNVDQVTITLPGKGAAMENGTFSSSGTITFT